MPGGRRTSTSRCSAAASPRGWSPRCTSPATRCCRSTRSTNGVPDAGARERLVVAFDLDITEPEWALGYRFDIVLRGRDATPFEETQLMPAATASQTIGPYWHLLERQALADLTRFGADGRAHRGSPAAITDGDGAAGARRAASRSGRPARRPTPRFPGYRPLRTDSEGRFRFVTLKPGPVPGRGNRPQAPHFASCVFARGLLTGARAPASTSRARPRTRPTRCSPRSRTRPSAARP